MRAAAGGGISDAVTYDPFVPEFATPPPGKFDLITCFETLEHMPDPLGGIGDIVAHLDEPGLVLFSTMLQPADFDQLGMDWWYVGPRNGHISMFSRGALAKAWGRHGYRTGSFDDNMHVAFRTLPEFARHLAKLRPFPVMAGHSRPKTACFTRLWPDLNHDCPPWTPAMSRG